ncbi:photosystem II protein PsbQ [Candidatus Gracilibacteria bacterium]|jgi:photosystem II protein PsbQ|nr:photosystem II protein PsbQ [Candidatus Gracilibacteria bacterium]NJM88958.1 photosystem II protein PsbQ [Hydrococcus sp. RU_2_2]NJP20408.1 photosystem II protein PsbQ [Hydrococcus sp. CRU_1_1]
MPRLRSILSLILVLVTTLLVSCSSPQAAVPTTYAPEKVAQLQVYVQPIEEIRGRMSELQTLIAKKNWVDAGTLIHGPFGDLRKDMLALSRSLLPKDQKQATEVAKEVFSHFERLDAAARSRNSEVAEIQFREALKDFDAFLNLIPKAS